MLRRYTWDSTKEKLKHYKRREPESSVLYQLVYHGRETLSQVWQDRFQPEYGVLRDEVLTTFDEYLNCGLLCHGAARVYCDNCKHSLLLAFSCKKRGVCPSCQAKRAVKFAEHLYDEVVSDVPSRHIVFTIPKRLRGYFRYDRSLNSILFRAAWDSIKETLGAAHATPALVLTIQTAGEALNFNPHLHGLLADGAFSDDGTLIPYPELKSEALNLKFADRVLAALRVKDLIDDDQVNQILSQEHTGFGVWIGEPFRDSDSTRFVARYVERGPLSLEKLTIQDDIVSYTTKDKVTHDFDPLEFLALLSPHIPKTYESMTRYYGWWSCRMRGDRRKKQQLENATQAITEPAFSETSEKPPKTSSSWAACIKRIYEIDPLECPKCKSQMRIIAFVQDPKAIADIISSLGLPNYRAPPKIPIPELLQEEFVIPNYDEF